MSLKSFCGSLLRAFTSVRNNQNMDLHTAKEWRLLSLFPKCLIINCLIFIPEGVKGERSLCFPHRSDPAWGGSNRWFSKKKNKPKTSVWHRHQVWGQRGCKTSFPVNQRQRVSWRAANGTGSSRTRPSKWQGNNAGDRKSSQRRCGGLSSPTSCRLTSSCSCSVSFMLPDTFKSSAPTKRKGLVLWIRSHIM